MNKKMIILLLMMSSIGFAQYGYRNGNRIGLSAGVTQTTLFTSNFNAKPELGFSGGLSVRGNYYNDWSMIYGMQFFSNSFSVETTSNSDVKYTVQGVQIRLLLSYNVVQDHVSIDFGPVLQVNGKLGLARSDENRIISGTLLKANDIIDVSPVSGNFYVGGSAGGKVVRAVLFYEYGFTNFLNKLNKDDNLQELNNGDKFKGNLGTINAQVIFNL